MKVLVTNDDGFDSEGIKLLKEIASNFASEVWIVAPDSEKSGSARSSSCLANHPIQINQYNKLEFSISGTPADCVIIALHKIMDSKPDLILSGVNFGSNVGEHICCSGTIGAAMEGVSRAIPSIALSQTCDENNCISWNNTETFAQKIIIKLIKIGWPKNIVMNVNFPAIKKAKGIKFATQGEYYIKSNVIFTENLDGSLSLDWGRDNTSGSGSVGEIHDGFITITPIKLDFTDYSTLKIMKDTYCRFDSDF
jgi:5'-nucleotidase